MKATPTFIRLFASNERSTEYIAISTITKAIVETKPLEKGQTQPQRELQVFTLEGARRTVTGTDAEEIIATLDGLSPGAVK